jgi:hypothetical protein
MEYALFLLRHWVDLLTATMGHRLAARASLTKGRASAHQMRRAIPLASAGRERALGGGCRGRILSAGTTQNKGYAHRQHRSSSGANQV